MKKALQALGKADPELAIAIKRVGPYKVDRPKFDSAYEALSRSVVYQQLSGKAAQTIYTRYVAGFGDGKRPLAERVAAASIDDLRSVGLSRQKANYLKGLSQAEMKGTIPTVATLSEMDDEAIIQALTEHKGIGVWTVQMLLMFWMGRQDVLPSEDLGIRKGFQTVYALDEMPSPKAVTEYGRRWRPWRTVASWYLWRILELD